MPIEKLIKISCTVVLSLLVIILLFVGLRINSYKIFITSLVDGEKQIGLNKNMTGFATDFPYIYSNGDFGIVVVNVLPYGTVRIIPNYKGFSKTFESPADSNLESLQRAYGKKLIILDTIDQFSEDERKIISEITKKDSKPRYDRDTWVTRSY
ncbi:hypothetical protein [Veillonella sp.]|uniref:hypothetical protein n=1 Tax=Veillonella sp. TaxID=1926307 RepID=UPI00291266CF|nr:hypothetical protein [Veillonella sp.]MDU6548743.1 hypothetical protein [Veillonella sp.]